jgi:hypothetical protein
MCHQVPLKEVQDGMCSLGSILCLRREGVWSKLTMKYVLLMSLRAPTVDALLSLYISLKEVLS